MQKTGFTLLTTVRRQLIIVALLIGFSATATRAQQVILEGFWWNYQNNNYPNGWANYVADLAPRLKALGINAVWIPPNLKTRMPTNTVYSNGYSPFDNYDLGDKYQHGRLRTNSGTKDELLRAVAILHANGIDVVQDIVLNHLDGAGSDDNNTGGQDPAAADDGKTNRMKNFRYVSYTSPASSETAANYLARTGRFAKNWQNFNPNPGNNTITGDWNAPYFGPDISYYPGSYGQSSNATYNPGQASDYMRNSTRGWLVWYKKQVGFDGVRLDAVKLFPDFATDDFLNSLQNSADWASGGATMFAVGEYAQATAAQMDQWVANVNNRAGTFDFSLRGGLLALIQGNGAFNIGSLPSYQQGTRVVTINGTTVHRTVPLVNNHDTFRPTVDASGNYTGWDTGGELYPHIDPSDPRLSAAYAVALAVDGSPQIFFEDLFNIGTTGKRFTHNPRNATDLPTRSDIENLIWCHQNLHFKDGAYKVPYQANDYLIIERSTTAIIGISDNWDTWQNVTISCDFPAGTVLKDYSGANGNATVTVSATQTVSINTPPCNGTAASGRRGYSVWAPVNAVTNYTLTGRATTQEWELADDLGDSDSRSLGQGGQLPAGSTAYRTAGRIYVGANKNISYTLYPNDATRNLTVTVFDNAGTSLNSVSGTGALNGSYTPTAEGWYLLKVKNSMVTNPGQRCNLKVTYTPPPVVVGAIANRESTPLATTPSSEAVEAVALHIFPNPITADAIAFTIQTPTAQLVTVQLYDLTGRLVHAQTAQLTPGLNRLMLNGPRSLNAGLYQLRVPELRLSQHVAME
ncbi:alpha-amylase family glycosyl hydrolase [Hymenobacter coccineus]|uniref:alpha-amylase family glycosyl hydrolase n=1 Tax=Hymenobacter coccineus TaxID=1908235 RepID=UPI0009F28DA2|nr:alpha-amylase family glycosyl hydrolase [Hymenobacter coccineus]